MSDKTSSLTLAIGLNAKMIEEELVVSRLYPCKVRAQNRTLTC